jgi:sulfonate transport system permease protein
MFPASLTQALDRADLSPPSHRRPWRGRLRGFVRGGGPFALPAALLLAWSLAARFGLIAPQILPAPHLVQQTLIELLTSGELPRHAAISLGRVLAGFLAGGLLGLGLGVALGVSRRVEAYVAPLFKALAQVPALGWLPLLMMLVGIGEALKVLVILQAALVPVALNVAAGIRGVPAAYLEVAGVLGFTRRQLVRQVVVPATLPAIFTGLRQGLMQAWLVLVTAELLASSEGLGFLIVWGRQLFQLDLVLAAIVVVGLTGLLLDRVLAGLEAWLLPWRREPFA